jgi:hypothetical protein
MARPFISPPSEFVIHNHQVIQGYLPLVNKGTDKGKVVPVPK